MTPESTPADALESGLGRQLGSGQTVTIDSLSHEGLLEDQGRDPVEYFASKGVPRNQVLLDGIAVARDYDRHTRSFDADGPHVVTGPIHVRGAAPGDVLKIELLTALLLVPYGVISSRHGKGALSSSFAPGGGITAAEVMPPVSAAAVRRSSRSTRSPASCRWPRWRARRSTTRS